MLQSTTLCTLLYILSCTSTRLILCDPNYDLFKNVDHESIWRVGCGTVWYRIPRAVYQYLINELYWPIHYQIYRYGQLPVIWCNIPPCYAVGQSNHPCIPTNIRMFLKCHPVYQLTYEQDYSVTTPKKRPGQTLPYVYIHFHPFHKNLLQSDKTPYSYHYVKIPESPHSGFWSKEPMEIRKKKPSESRSCCNKGVKWYLGYKFCVHYKFWKLYFMPVVSSGLRAKMQAETTKALYEFKKIKEYLIDKSKSMPKGQYAPLSMADFIPYLHNSDFPKKNRLWDWFQNMLSKLGQFKGTYLHLRLDQDQSTPRGQFNPHWNKFTSPWNQFKAPNQIRSPFLPQNFAVPWNHNFPCKRPCSHPPTTIHPYEIQYENDDNQIKPVIPWSNLRANVVKERTKKTHVQVSWEHPLLTPYRPLFWDPRKKFYLPVKGPYGALYPKQPTQIPCNHIQGNPIYQKDLKSPNHLEINPCRRGPSQHLIPYKNLPRPRTSPFIPYVYSAIDPKEITEANQMIPGTDELPWDPEDPTITPYDDAVTEQPAPENQDKICETYPYVKPDKPVWLNGNPSANVLPWPLEAMRPCVHSVITGTPCRETPWNLNPSMIPYKEVTPFKKVSGATTFQKPCTHAKVQKGIPFFGQELPYMNLLNPIASDKLPSYVANANNIPEKPKRAKINMPTNFVSPKICFPKSPFQECAWNEQKYPCKGSFPRLNPPVSTLYSEPEWGPTFIDGSLSGLPKSSTLPWKLKSARPCLQDQMLGMPVPAHTHTNYVPIPPREYNSWPPKHICNNLPVPIVPKTYLTCSALDVPNILKPICDTFDTLKAPRKYAPWVPKPICNAFGVPTSPQKHPIGDTLSVPNRPNAYSVPITPKKYRIPDIWGVPATRNKYPFYDTLGLPTTPRNYPICKAFSARITPIKHPNTWGVPTTPNKHPNTWGMPIIPNKYPICDANDVPMTPKNPPITWVVPITPKKNPICDVLAVPKTTNRYPICDAIGVPITPMKYPIWDTLGVPITPKKFPICDAFEVPMTPNNHPITWGVPITPKKPLICDAYGVPITPKKRPICDAYDVPNTPKKYPIFDAYKVPITANNHPIRDAYDKPVISKKYPIRDTWHVPNTAKPIFDAFGVPNTPKPVSYKLAVPITPNKYAPWVQKAKSVPITPCKSPIFRASGVPITPQAICDIWPGPIPRKNSMLETSVGPIIPRKSPLFETSGVPITRRKYINYKAFSIPNTPKLNKGQFSPHELVPWPGRAPTPISVIKPPKPFYNTFDVPKTPEPICERLKPLNAFNVPNVPRHFAPWLTKLNYDQHFPRKLVPWAPKPICRTFDVPCSPRKYAPWMPKYICSASGVPSATKPTYSDLDVPITPYKNPMYTLGQPIIPKPIFETSSEPIKPITLGVPITKPKYSRYDTLGVPITPSKYPSCYTWAVPIKPKPTIEASSVPITPPKYPTYDTLEVPITPSEFPSYDTFVVPVKSKPIFKTSGEPITPLTFGVPIAPRHQSFKTLGIPITPHQYPSYDTLGEPIKPKPIILTSGEPITPITLGVPITPRHQSYNTLGDPITPHHYPSYDALGEPIKPKPIIVTSGEPITPITLGVPITPGHQSYNILGDPITAHQYPSYDTLGEPIKPKPIIVTSGEPITPITLGVPITPPRHQSYNTLGVPITPQQYPSYLGQPIKPKPIIMTTGEPIIFSEYPNYNTLGVPMTPRKYPSFDTLGAPIKPKPIFETSGEPITLGVPITKPKYPKYNMLSLPITPPKYPRYANIPIKPKPIFETSAVSITPRKYPTFDTVGVPITPCKYPSYDTLGVPITHRRYPSYETLSVPITPRKYPNYGTLDEPIKSKPIIETLGQPISLRKYPIHSVPIPPQPIFDTSGVPTTPRQYPSYDTLGVPIIPKQSICETFKVPITPRKYPTYDTLRVPIKQKPILKTSDLPSRPHKYPSYNNLNVPITPRKVPISEISNVPKTPQRHYNATGLPIPLRKLPWSPKVPIFYNKYGHPISPLPLYDSNGHPITPNLDVPWNPKSFYDQHAHPIMPIATYDNSGYLDTRNKYAPWVPINDSTGHPITLPFYDVRGQSIRPNYYTPSVPEDSKQKLKRPQKVCTFDVLSKPTPPYPYGNGQPVLPKKMRYYNTLEQPKYIKEPIYGQPIILNENWPSKVNNPSNFEQPIPAFGKTSQVTPHRYFPREPIIQEVIVEPITPVARLGEPLKPFKTSGEPISPNKSGQSMPLYEKFDKQVRYYPSLPEGSLPYDIINEQRVPLKLEPIQPLKQYKPISSPKPLFAQQIQPYKYFPSKPRPYYSINQPMTKHWPRKFLKPSETSDKTSLPYDQLRQPISNRNQPRFTLGQPSPSPQLYQPKTSPIHVLNAANANDRLTRTPFTLDNTQHPLVDKSQLISPRYPLLSRGIRTLPWSPNQDRLALYESPNKMVFPKATAWSRPLQEPRSPSFKTLPCPTTQQWPRFSPTIQESIKHPHSSTEGFSPLSKPVAIPKQNLSFKKPLSLHESNLITSPGHRPIKYRNPTIQAQAYPTIHKPENQAEISAVPFPHVIKEYKPTVVNPFRLQRPAEIITSRPKEPYQPNYYHTYKQPKIPLYISSEYKPSILTPLAQNIMRPMSREIDNIPPIDFTPVKVPKPTASIGPIREELPVLVPNTFRPLMKETTPTLYPNYWPVKTLNYDSNMPKHIPTAPLYERMRSQNQVRLYPRIYPQNKKDTYRTPNYVAPYRLPVSESLPTNSRFTNQIVDSFPITKVVPTSYPSTISSPFVNPRFERPNLYAGLFSTPSKENLDNNIQDTNIKEMSIHNAMKAHIIPDINAYSGAYLTDNNKNSKNPARATTVKDLFRKRFLEYSNVPPKTSTYNFEYVPNAQSPLYNPLCNLQGDVAKYLQETNIQDRLYNHPDKTEIPLQNLSILKYEPSNAEVFDTEYPHLHYITWYQKVVEIKPTLVLQPSEKYIKNYMLILNDKIIKHFTPDQLNGYAFDYIKSKYGEPTVLNGVYHYEKPYAIVNSDGLKNHVLWPPMCPFSNKSGCRCMWGWA